MKKIIVLTLIFLLTFNTALAQYRISGELNKFGFLKGCFPYDGWEGDKKADYYIKNFYYLSFRENVNDTPIITNPLAPYKEYIYFTSNYNYICLPIFNFLFGKIKLNKFLWRFDNTSRIVLFDGELQEINKIYVYKGKIKPLSHLATLIEADGSKDLVTTIENLNFTFYNSSTIRIGLFHYVPLYFYFSPSPNTFNIEKNLNNISLDGTMNIYGSYLFGYNPDFAFPPYPNPNNFTKPNEMLIFIAEGKTANNNIKRKLVANIETGEYNYLKFLYYSDLFIFIEAPTGAFNPNDYDNKLIFKLYAPEGYNLYKWWLEIIDNNTGKNLYTSNVFNFTNYDISYDKVVLDLSYYFNLKQVLINIRNQGYSNLQLNLYVKLKDNEDNETPYLSSATTLELLGGISRGEFTYKDWYSDIIATFGLSGATPTPIFIKAGEFIDKLFSFSLLPTFDIENVGKNLAEKFNVFISYLKAFPFTSAFLLAILGFYTFRLAYKFIKLVTLR
jgi:hypothetical protein